MISSSLLTVTTALIFFSPGQTQEEALDTLAGEVLKNRNRVNEIIGKLNYNRKELEEIYQRLLMAESQLGNLPQKEIVGLRPLQEELNALRAELNKIKAGFDKGEWLPKVEAEKRMKDAQKAFADQEMRRFDKGVDQIVCGLKTGNVKQLLVATFKNGKIDPPTNPVQSRIVQKICQAYSGKIMSLPPTTKVFPHPFSEPVKCENALVKMGADAILFLEIDAEFEVTWFLYNKSTPPANSRVYKR